MTSPRRSLPRFSSQSRCSHEMRSRHPLEGFDQGLLGASWAARARWPLPFRPLQCSSRGLSARPIARVYPQVELARSSPSYHAGAIVRNGSAKNRQTKAVTDLVELGRSTDAFRQLGLRDGRIFRSLTVTTLSDRVSAPPSTLARDHAQESTSVEFSPSRRGSRWFYNEPFPPVPLHFESDSNPF